MTQETKLAYTPQEAADALGVSVKTIYREIRSGRLLARKIGPGGRSWIIPERHLNDFIYGQDDGS